MKRQIQKQTHFLGQTLGSNRGFTLMEILVAVGVLAIVTMAIVELLASQNKEVKALNEKMGLQSVETTAMNVLSNAPYCMCFIGNRTFNYSTVAWNAFPTSMASSYDAACNPQGGQAFMTVGTEIPGTNLRPTSISMTNISETVIGSGNFAGNLVIEFDQARLTRSRKSLSVPLFFKLDMSAPATNRPITSCTTGTGGGVDLATLCTQIGGVYDAAATPPCQPTYQ